MATVPASSRSTTITLASDSAGPFLVGFRLFETDALSVYVDGVSRADWSLMAAFADGFDDAATVTFAADLASGSVVIIDGDMAIRREEDYLRRDPRMVDQINAEQARQIAMMQETRRDAGRSIRALTPMNPITPSPFGYLRFDEDGQPEVSEPLPDLTAISELLLGQLTDLPYTFSGDGTALPHALPLTLSDVRQTFVTVHGQAMRPGRDYRLSDDGRYLIPVGTDGGALDVWPYGDDNIAVWIRRQMDQNNITTDDVTYGDEPLTVVLDGILPANVLDLGAWLERHCPADWALGKAGTATGQNAAAVTAAVQAFWLHAHQRFSAQANVGLVELPAGTILLNDEMIPEAAAQLLWDNSGNGVWDRGFFIRSNGLRVEIDASYVPERIRTSGLYAEQGIAYPVPSYVFRWEQSGGGQNLRGWVGPEITVTGRSSNTGDPGMCRMFRINGLRASGGFFCGRNLRRHTALVLDQCQNIHGLPVHISSGCGWQPTEYGSGNGWLPTTVRFTVSGSTITASQPVFGAGHVGLMFAVNGCGPMQVINGVDQDMGEESTSRVPWWSTIATYVSPTEVTWTDAPPAGVSSAYGSFAALRFTSTAESDVYTLSAPVGTSLVGMQVTAHGAGRGAGNAGTTGIGVGLNVRATVTAHSGDQITLDQQAHRSVTLGLLTVSEMVHMGTESIGLRRPLSEVKRCDDIWAQMHIESSNTPCVQMTVGRGEGIHIAGKLHGASPRGVTNFGGNCANLIMGRVDMEFSGQLSHGMSSPHFGKIMAYGDKVRAKISGTNSAWTAGTRSAIYYLDPDAPQFTEWFLIRDDLESRIGVFPISGASQVYERGGANYRTGLVRHMSSATPEQGAALAVWPPHDFAEARANAWGSTRARMQQALDSLWVPTPDVVYHAEGSDYLGVPDGQGHDGLSRLHGFKKPLVLLAWGQSNTAGNGTGGDLRVNPRVRLFDTDASVPVAGTVFNRAKFGIRPIDKTSGGLPVNNAAIHAAGRLADDLDVDVYVVMVARGGVVIEAFLTDAILTANGWSRGAWPDLSGLLLDSLTAALPLIPGAPATVDMVMSIHGEGNRTDAPTLYASKYMALMTMLSDAGRVDLKTVRAVAGEISVNAHTRYYENHKAALAEIDATYGSTTLPGFVAVSSVGVEVNTGDETHYSGPGLVEYGRRIANAALGPTIRSAGGSTRAHYVAACARGWRAGDGLLYPMDGYLFRGRTGANTLPGLPGLVPVAPYHIDQWGVTPIANDGTTAPSDQSAAIQSALTWVAANGGGEIEMADGCYGIASTLVIEGASTVLRGQGFGWPGSSKVYSKSSSRTRIAWVGASAPTGAMLLVTSDKDDTGAKRMSTGSGARGIHWDGCELCGNGAIIKSVMRSVYQCRTSYFTDVHFEATVLVNGVIDAPHSNQYMDWIIHADEVLTSAPANALVVIGGGGGSNTSVGTIREMKLMAESTAVAAHFAASDTLSVEFCTATTRTTASGDGGKIFLHAADTCTIRPTNDKHARAIQFGQLQANLGIVAKAAIDPLKEHSRGNVIHYLAMDNSVVVPTVEAGAVLAWTQGRLASGVHALRQVGRNIDNSPIGQDGKATGAFTALTGETIAYATGFTTASWDTTAGRVLKVGDGGLLLTGNAQLLADLDAISTASGFYRVDGTTTGTWPLGGAVAGTVQFMRQSSGGAQSQTFIVAASGTGGRAGQMYTRVYDATGAAWLAWQPVIRPLSGTTAQRPTGTWRFVGLAYHDTTLVKPIWWDGSNWKDATGATV